MWRVYALILAALALLATAPAAGAGEHKLTSGEVFDISAYRGWLLWTEYDDAGPHGVVWRGSRRRFTAHRNDPSGVLGPRLGSDSSGRTVVLYESCAEPGAYPGVYRDCRLVRHSLATGAERTIRRAPDSTSTGAFDMAQGDLAMGLQASPDSSVRDLTLFRPGTPAVRVSRDDPSALDVESGWLAYVAFRRSGDDYEIARVIDLRPRRPRYRTLAAVDVSRQDARIPGAVVTEFTSAAVDGRYAYWLRARLRDTYNSSAFEVLRARLDDPNATVESLWLEHPAASIAVARGSVYYTSTQLLDEAGVYEVRKPAWQDTGLTTPLEQ